jgi:hypothetical protein
MSRHDDREAMTPEQVWVLTVITFGMAAATIILMWMVI